MAEERRKAASDASGDMVESMVPSLVTAEDNRRAPNLCLTCIKEKWVLIAVTMVITILLIIIITLADTEESWNSSQSNCSSHGASLAVIDSIDDLEFMLRHKGRPYYWIGLWKETSQLWRWTNGTVFNYLFPIRGEGDCAYVNDDGVSSSRCSSKRNFICSQPDNCARGKPSSLMGNIAADVM
ncbi:C-type lectin domain family 2 member D-like isoform X3 [Alligator mississippiensis]|uniref:C-type lectin domain family 2 member D-like isoform X3 n=1 Tax=Alligator mississippiensis TaxID=8496 RepID=UPI002877C1AE|nr:C-type lectin domain family 2 member D-like isoform X3 [Alligator mississippiensis]